MAAPAAPTPTEASPEIEKIVVDRDLCIGAGSCAALANRTFELDGENKAVVKNPAGDDAEKIRLAAQSCPVFAIFLYGKDGQQLYPEEDSTTGGQSLNP